MKQSPIISQTRRKDVVNVTLILTLLMVALMSLVANSALAQQKREGMILIPYEKDLHVANPTNRPMGINGAMTVEGWVWVGSNLDLPLFGFKGEADQDGIIGVRYLHGETNKWQVILRDLPQGSSGHEYKYSLPYVSGYSGPTTIGGSWNHIAVTASGSEFRLYINGELAVANHLNVLPGVRWLSIIPSGEGNRSFGGDLFGTKRTFWMSEVRIWRTVLEESEIEEYYDEEVNSNHPHWNDLVRYYHGTEQSSGRFPSRSPHYAHDAYGDAQLSLDVTVMGSFPVVKPPRVGDLANLAADDCQLESGRIDVNWTNLNSSSSYINGNSVSYQLRKDNAEIHWSNSNNYDDFDLTNGEAYDYSLRTFWTVNGTRYYSDDDATDVGSVKEHFDAPTGFSATEDLCDGTIELEWSSSKTPQYWRIQRSTDDFFNFYDEYIVSDLDGSVNSYTDNTPGAELTYYYRIEAYGDDDNGCAVDGDWTTADVTGFTRVKPKAPNSLSLTQDLVNKQLELSWNNTDNLSTDGYVIKREKLDGSDVTYFTIDDKDITTFTDTGIELCQTYRYTVGSVNECNSDDESDASFAMTDVSGNISEDLSNMISSFSASKSYYPDRVRLEWDVFGSLSQVDRFRISRSPMGQNEFDLIKTETGLIYDDETAIGGVMYDYKVAAEAQCEDNIILSNEMTDVGFITSFGIANGHIQYEGGNPVEGVALTVERTSGLQTGNSAQFGINGFATQVAEEEIALDETSFTVEFWAKKNSASSSDILFQWGDAGSRTIGKSVAFGISDYAVPYVSFGEHTSTTLGTAVPNSTEWNHYAFSYDADIAGGDDDQFIYLNGELIGSGESSNDLIEPDNRGFTIGTGSLFGVTVAHEHPFRGKMDEFKIWRTVRSQEEIQRDMNRIINAANADLLVYYRFDEGQGTSTYDVSNNGFAYNKVDVDFSATGVSFSDDIPDASQLGIRGITDEFGDYTIDYIPYLGGGEVFRMVPSLGQHEFSPNSRSIFVGDGSKTNNGVDYTDISSFEVSGKVTYENSVFPVEGALLLLDGETALGPDGQAVRTDTEGNYTMSVPIGKHYISVYMEGHYFKQGVFPPLNEFGDIQFHEFTEPLYTVNFIDSTKVKIAGRVVGGNIEGNKEIGFDLSINNIGESTVSLKVQREGYDIDTTSAEIYDTYTVTTDPYSGEFELEVIPEIWVANGNVGNSTYFIASDDLSPFDLRESLEVITANDTIWFDEEDPVTGLMYEARAYDYHEKLNFIIQTTPVVEVYGEADGENYLPFSGSDEITLSAQELIDGEILNVETSYDIASFGFIHPVFKMGYQYEANIFVTEQYANPNHPDGAILDKVPVAGAELDITNNIMLFPTGETVTTDANGQYTHTFQAGTPNFTEDGDNSFTKTFEVEATVEGLGVTWRAGDPFRGYVLGALPLLGTDFITQAPAQVDFVLRDPPGSNSYAFVEAGSSFTKGETWSMTQFSDLGLATEFRKGMFVEAGGGLAGPVVRTEIIDTGGAGLSIVKSTDYKGGFTTTVTFNERIETSSDPEDVGSIADIYVGNSENYLINETKTLEVMKKTNADALGLPYIGTGEWVMAVSSGFSASESGLETFFIYSQRQILEELIPDLIIQRNTLFQLPNYTSNLDADHFCYGMSNDHTSLDEYLYDGASAVGDASYTFTPTAGAENDSIDWYNRQITSWLTVIATNEAEKVNAQTVQNISIDGSGGAYTAEIEENFSAEFNWESDRTLNIFFNGEFGGLANNKGITVSTNSHISVGATTGEVNAESNSVKFGYVIDERDEGDYYTIDIKKAEGIQYFNRDDFVDVIPAKGDFLSALNTGIGDSRITSIGLISAYGITPIVLEKTLGKAAKTNAIAGSIAFGINTAVWIYEMVDMGIMMGSTINEADRLVDRKVGGFSIGSPIFSVRGGQTRCPWEPEEYATFVVNSSGTGLEKLHTATLKREAPVISATPAIQSNVPEDEAAVFTLSLGNESESNSDLWYEISIDETTNPDGAVVLIDGLTAERSFLVPAFETIEKTLTISKGASGVLEYDSIGIIFHSLCQFNAESSQAEIADTVYVSARFLPACSDVTIENINENFVLNYYDNDQATVTLGGYNINLSTLESIDFQYKTLSGDPITEMTYFKDEHSDAYINYTGNKAILENATESFVWDIEALTDREYQVRARAKCIDGSVTATEYITGTIDRSTPVAFGSPEPADGILSIGDDISILFNEDIEGGLVKDHNISVRGVLNAYEVSHNASIAFDGIDDKAEVPGVSLNDKSFTIEFWLKRGIGTEGAVVSKGSGTDKVEVAFAADGSVTYTLGNTTLDVDPLSSYSIVYPEDAWHHWAFVYDAEAEHATVYIDDQTLLNHSATFNSQPTETFYIGSGSGQTDHLASQVHELRIWERTLTFGEVVSQMSVTLTGNEFGLYGYWPMDEAFGTGALDRAAGRHMTFDATWAIEPGGYAMAFDGDDYLELNSQLVVIDPMADMTIEFWFKGGAQTGDATFLSSGFGYADPSLKVEIYAEAATGNIKVKSDQEVFLATEQNVLDDTWHHFAMTVDRRSLVKTYIDGELQNQGIATDLGGLAGANIWLGAQATEEDPITTSFDNYFTGSLDEVRIWNAVRTIDIMDAYRHAKLQGNEMGLMAYYPFEAYENVGGVDLLKSNMADQSALSNHEAVIEGDATLTEEVPTIKDARPVQDIPFSYAVSSDGIVLSLNIDENRIEGQMIEIAVENVQDLFGNRMLSPVIWHAYLDRNPVIWQESTYSLELDDNSDFSFTATIVNRSGLSQPFSLENIPVWLTASEDIGVIGPDETREITFYINDGLNIGTYERSIALSSDFGYDESLDLSVTILADKPDWFVDPSLFEHSMSIFGSLWIESVVSTDTRDIVAVFVDGQCRGVGNLYYEEGISDYLLALTVYGDTGDDLEFRVWDASTGNVYGDVSPYDMVFTRSSIEGSPLAPVRIETSPAIISEVLLAEGWNWISVNLEANENDIATIFEGVMADQLVVKNDIVSAKYDAEFGWITTSGAASDIDVDPASGYKVYSPFAQTLELRGEPYDPTNTSIAIAAGWNHIGFVPQLAMSVEEALAYMQPESGDLIKTQGAFAQYVDGIGWIGSLTNMQPNVGYVLNVQSAGSLIYPAFSSIATGRVDMSAMAGLAAVPSHLKANVRDYEADMSIIAQIKDEAEILEGNEVLVAYHNGEVRGAITPVMVDEVPTYFLSAFGETAEELTFELYNAEGEFIIEANNTLDFVASAIVGRAEEAYFINVGGVALGAQELEVEPTVYPNPFRTNLSFTHGFELGTEINVYMLDLSGRVLFNEQYKSDGIGRVDITHPSIYGLDAGVYMLKLQAGEIVRTIKIIKL